MSEREKVKAEHEKSFKAFIDELPERDKGGLVKMIKNRKAFVYVLAMAMF